MTANGWLQIALFTALIALLVRPLGGYMTRVFQGERTVLGSLFGPVERLVYRVAGINPTSEQRWIDYALALLAFNAAGVVVLYALQRLQGVLPLSPQNFGAVDPGLALNTAVSFTTNTSWQSYGGETTLGYLNQMTGITVQSFLSAAIGIAVAVALVRGFARRNSQAIGNFWVDFDPGTVLRAAADYRRGDLGLAGRAADARQLDRGYDP
jgi:K+-transporting ATPase ATPase A chain